MLLTDPPPHADSMRAADARAADARADQRERGRRRGRAIVNR